MGEFEEWRKRFGHPRIKKEGKTTGGLIRRNLIIDKIQFRTKDKATIALRDVRAVTDEVAKEFPIKGWLFGIQHDLSQEECLELYQWFVRWLMPEAQKSKNEEK